MGLVVAIARILNEKRLQDKLDDKIAELKKQGLSFNAKKATCCSKCYRYFFKTKDRAETHQEIIDIFSYENIYSMHHKVIELEKKVQKMSEGCQCNSKTHSEEKNPNDDAELNTRKVDSECGEDQAFNPIVTVIEKEEQLVLRNKRASQDSIYVSMVIQSEHETEEKQVKVNNVLTHHYPKMKNNIQK